MPLAQFLLFVPVLLLSIAAHEAAHGYTALAYGDPTALLAGRCTLNPVKHLDPLGGVLIPIITYAIGGFPVGWAKQLPVNEENLPSPRYMALVCGAGPMVNVAIAAAVTIAILVLRPTGDALHYMDMAAKLNLALALLNLLPWPGSDGWQIIKALRAPT